MNYKIVLLNLLIIAIAISGWVWYRQALTPAPEITFTTITDKKIALKDLLGKTILINFWATDCKSCIEEVPHLIELYENYHLRGLEIIAVNMYYDLPNHVVAMTTAQRIPYHVALDLRSEHAAAFGDVQLTPTTFVINPQGKISFKKTGMFDVLAMKKRIETLVSNSL